VLDPGGKLLAWYQPEKSRGYDKVLHLGWDFIEHKVPRDTRHKTGLKIYLINAVYDDTTLQGFNWQHDPAMVFGSFVDSLAAWYPYSGDEEAIAAVREMLDHMLAHGTTPAGWEWPGVPFATNCDDQPDYGHCIQDMPRAFYGGIETDKVGELGIGYALFYEMTGERKYLMRPSGAGRLWPSMCAPETPNIHRGFSVSTLKRAKFWPAKSMAELSRRRCGCLMN
jgi:hypothetical protein